MKVYVKIGFVQIIKKKKNHIEIRTKFNYKIGYSLKLQLYSIYFY